jgi:hypothetical protein
LTGLRDLAVLNSRLVDGWRPPVPAPIEDASLKHEDTADARDEERELRELQRVRL